MTQHRADGAPPRRSTSMAWLWWLIVPGILIAIGARFVAWTTACDSNYCGSDDSTATRWAHALPLVGGIIAGLVVLFIVCNWFARRFPGTTAVFEGAMAAKQLRDGHYARAAISAGGAAVSAQRWNDQRDPMARFERDMEDWLARGMPPNEQPILNSPKYQT